MNLNIEGPIENLKRDGNIFIQNGVLYTQLLNDPIKSINGEALLTNNKLEIKELYAKIDRYNAKMSVK